MPFRTTGLCGVVAREDLYEQDMVLVREVCEYDGYRVRDWPDSTSRVIDVGGHIGSFVRRVKNRYPDARIITVEPDDAHKACLDINIAEYEDVQHIDMAVSYSPRPVNLYSVVSDKALNTGLSYVAEGPMILDCDGGCQHVERKVEVITLEEIANAAGWDQVDVVKLDCEGSEVGILTYCDLDRYKKFVGEWHDRAKFMSVIAARFTEGWDFRIFHDGPVGFFSLTKRT